MRKVVHWIDDEAIKLEGVVKQIQNKSDVIVRMYNNEDTFFKNYRQYPIEIIFLDYYMGNSDRTGLDILKKIRAEKINSRIVIISGMLDIEATKKLIFSGASDVLEKKSPVSLVTEVFKQLALAEISYQSSRSREIYSGLSEKQRLICDLMIERLTNIEIMKKTGLGYSNVRKLKGQIFEEFRKKGYLIKNSKDFSKIFKA